MSATDALRRLCAMADSGSVEVGHKRVVVWARVSAGGEQTEAWGRNVEEALERLLLAVAESKRQA